MSHLFANRELRGQILIEADRRGNSAGAGRNDSVSVYVEGPVVREYREYDEWGAEVPEGAEDEEFLLHIKWSNAEEEFRFSVTDEGLLIGPGRPNRARSRSRQAVQFVRTSGVTATDIVQSFSRFVLTPKEEDITQALRIVEPTIERIAPVADDRGRLDRIAPGGVVLKLRDVADRVPIGSMGGGMWRMLGLALSISNAEGGVLLVDEIDTGLHYSVMEDMWRMIGKQAAALSVQVFATTHSRDCYESLAAISKSEPGDVTIQRIDRRREEAVGVSGEAIVRRRRSEHRGSLSCPGGTIP